jgi:hypothetical protein
MEDEALKEIWKEYDRKLEESKILNLQSWVLNLQSFEIIQTLKAKKKLNALARFKKWVIASGIVWVLLLAFLVYHSLVFSKLFFVISLSAIMGFTSYAIFVYIRQVAWIRQIDNSESIVETQKKLALLQSSTLKVVGILFLQSPFYCTWFFTPEWAMQGDPGFWFVAVPIAILFTILSIWLYRNISFKNVDKKWFRVLFNSIEWTAIVKAKQFIDEIEEYKKDR